MNDFLNENLRKIKNKETASIVYGVLFLICLLALIGYFSTKHLPVDDPSQKISYGRLGLSVPIFSFRKEYSRWPETKEELQTFVDKTKLDTTLKPYTKIIFHQEKDGSLRIDYWFKAPFEIESGTFFLTKP